MGKDAPLHRVSTTVISQSSYLKSVSYLVTTIAPDCHQCKNCKFSHYDLSHRVANFNMQPRKKEEYGR